MSLDKILENIDSNKIHIARLFLDYLDETKQEKRDEISFYDVNDFLENIEGDIVNLIKDAEIPLDKKHFDNYNEEVAIQDEIENALDELLKIKGEE